jgi:hypothetical protein
MTGRILEGEEVMNTLHTLKSVSEEMKFNYHSLRRLAVANRIPGVGPIQKGRWHYLTGKEVEAIKAYIMPRLKQK